MQAPCAARSPLEAAERTDLRHHSTMLPPKIDEAPAML